MSKVFNMVGGGGKNISSIVITGLESTDTVTCTKDGKSYITAWDSTAQHWEIVGLPLGTFTVTATNGTKTKTETVLIDIAGVYEIEMSFTLWLYRDGDECEDVTGGWTTLANGSFTASKQNDYLDCYGTNGSGSCLCKTVNGIDVTNYTTLHYVSQRANSAGSSYLALSTVSPYYGSSGLVKDVIASDDSSTTKGERTMDISSISGIVYPYLYTGGYEIKMWSIWLE